MDITLKHNFENSRILCLVCFFFNFIIILPHAYAHNFANFHNFTDYQDIRKDNKRMEHFESLSHVLRELLGNTHVPNDVELLGIYGRVRCM